MGKSSLISTFVARHFPSNVPNVSADATIPAESSADQVAVTIMDSSSRPSDRESLRLKISSSDVVIALFDGTRPETLDSLSHLWIPLITELGATKPIVVAGTKSDLLHLEEGEGESEGEMAAALRGLLDQWPSVAWAATCSSVNLDVDAIFNAAATAVNHPSLPLFDAQGGWSARCLCALRRVFRIHDLDGDGLWTDEDMQAMQQACFEIPLTARDLRDTKRQLHLLGGATANDRITFRGFLAIIDMCVTKGLVVLWTILRRYGYDDELALHVDEEVLVPPRMRAEEVPEVSAGAKAFLTALVRQACGDKEVGEEVSWKEVLEEVLGAAPPCTSSSSPWATPPASYDPLSPVAQCLLLPQMRGNTSPFRMSAWQQHWSALAMSDPSRAIVLLHKLGYVERADLGLVASGGTCLQLRDKCAATPPMRWWPGSGTTALPRPRGTARVCVLGGNGVGKSSLVWYASGLNPSEASGKACEAIVVGSSLMALGDDSGSGGEYPHLCDPLCVVLAAVPMDHVQRWCTAHLLSCDVALLVFQVGDMASLQTALELERALPDHLPRIFVAHKADLLAHRPGLLQKHESVLESAQLHVRDNDLPAVLCTSTASGEGMAEVLAAVRQAVLVPETAQPRRYVPQQQAWVSSRSLGLLALGALSLSAGFYAFRRNEQIKAALTGLLDGGAQLMLST